MIILHLAGYRNVVSVDDSFPIAINKQAKIIKAAKEVRYSVKRAVRRESKNLCGYKSGIIFIAFKKTSACRTLLSHSSLVGWPLATFIVNDERRRI